MYPHQTERLTEALDRAGLEALVATSPANIGYITGHRGSTEAVGREFGVFARGATALVGHVHEIPADFGEGIEVDHVVRYLARGESKDGSSAREARRSQTIEASAARSPGEALAAALERVGVRSGKVGVDESHLTHEGWRRLTAELSGIEVRPGAGELAAARRVKGPYEIECLGRALHVTEEALDVVIQAIDRGMTEREAATLFATEVVKRGAWPRRPLVAMGERAGLPGAWPTDRALRSAQLVCFDVGCVYKGHCSRVARSAVLGEAPALAETLYRGVQAGLEAAIGAVSAGTAAGRVFDAAMEAVRAHGLPDGGHEHVGGGIGLEWREAPELGAGNATLIEPGEVLRIALSHREVGSLGVSVQDTVLVTTAGARVLNRSHHGLVVLE